jgi:hypothetical protein
MRAALGVRAGAKECRQHLWKSFGTGTNNNLKTASDFELDLKLGLAEAGFARAIGNGPARSRRQNGTASHPA